MALPILETATYELTLPSADIVVKYRPFLVKEEKVLLQALESGDDNEIKNAINEDEEIRKEEERKKEEQQKKEEEKINRIKELEDLIQMKQNELNELIN